MGSSEHNGGYISPPICTNGLIYRKWTIFILFFLDMPIYPILSQMSVFVTTLLSCPLTQIMSAPGLRLNGNVCGDERLKTPKWQLQNLGHLSFPSLPVSAPELNGSLCFSFIFFPTQTLSHLDYNFFSYLRFKTDTQFSDNISAKTATHCYMLNPHATMVVKRAQVFNILEGRTKTSLSFLMIINTQTPLA